MVEGIVGRGKRASIAAYVHSAIIVRAGYECNFVPLKRLEHVGH